MPEIIIGCDKNNGGPCIIDELRESRAIIQRRIAGFNTEIARHSKELDRVQALNQSMTHEQVRVEDLTERIKSIKPCSLCVYDSNPEI